MKYLKVFETETQQNEFRIEGDDYLQPHVSCLEDGSKVKYNIYSKEYYKNLNVPFTIESTQDETTIYFRQSSYAADDGLDPLKVEVSTDNGETWTEITAAPSGDEPGALLAELDSGDKVLIRGKNEAYGFYEEENAADTVDNCNFYADKPCYVYGNIMSLVGGDDFARLREVKEYAFAYLFSDYDSEFEWSWVLSKEGEELLLPATTLASNCYRDMFQMCTGLITAPELPATTLSQTCYAGMFYGCTGLTSTPALPATTLAEFCYSAMFWGCTGLTAAPELPATTLADYCYFNMFYDCSNLAYIKAMFTTTPSNLYTLNWVKNVKATGTFVKNSAATWDVTGVHGVPTGWTVETASS